MDRILTEQWFGDLLKAVNFMLGLDITSGNK